MKVILVLMVLLFVSSASGACSDNDYYCEDCVALTECVWCVSSSTCTELATLTADCSIYKNGSCNYADASTTEYTIIDSNTVVITARDYNGDLVPTGGDNINILMSKPASLQYPSHAEWNSVFSSNPGSRATGLPDVQYCGDSYNAAANYPRYSPPYKDRIYFYFDESFLSTEPIGLSVYENYGAGSLGTITFYGTDFTGYSKNFKTQFVDRSSCPEGALMSDYQPSYNLIPGNTNTPLLLTAFTITTNASVMEIDTASVFANISKIVPVEDLHDGTYILRIPKDLNVDFVQISIYVDSYAVTTDPLFFQLNKTTPTPTPTPPPVNVICSPATNCGDCIKSSGGGGSGGCVWCSSTSQCVFEDAGCVEYKKDTCSVADVSTTTTTISADNSTLTILTKDANGILVSGDVIQAYFLSEISTFFATSANVSSHLTIFSKNRLTGPPDSICDDDQFSWYTTTSKSSFQVSFGVPVIPVRFNIYSGMYTPPTNNFSVSLTVSNTITTQTINGSIIPTACNPTNDNTLNHPSTFSVPNPKYYLSNSLFVTSANVDVRTSSSGFSADAVGVEGYTPIYLPVTDLYNGHYSVNLRKIPYSSASIYFTINSRPYSFSPITVEQGDRGCPLATPVTIGSVVKANISLSGLSGFYIREELAQKCSSLSAKQQALWYYFIGTGATVKVNTCNSTVSNLIAVMSSSNGNCSASNMSCVVASIGNQGCNCEDPSLVGAQVTFETTVGVTYFIVVQSASELNFILRVENLQDAITPPPNDRCSGAINIPYNTTTRTFPIIMGELTGSTSEIINQCGGEVTVIPGQSVWYKVIGRRHTSVSLNFCNATLPISNITVFSGSDCNSLCSVSTMELSPCNDINGHVASEGFMVTFPTEKSVIYHILVQGNNDICSFSRINFTVGMVPPPVCKVRGFINEVIYDGEAIDPEVSFLDYLEASSCFWASLPEWENKTINLSFDKQQSFTLSPNDESYFVLSDTCGASEYELLSNISFSRSYILKNGMNVNLRMAQSCFKAYVTTEPYKSVVVPPLYQWAAVKFTDCGDGYGTTQSHFVATNTGQDTLYVVQLAVEEAEFYVVVMNFGNYSDSLVKVPATSSTIFPLIKYSQLFPSSHVEWVGFSNVMATNDKIYVFGGEVIVTTKSNDQTFWTNSLFCIDFIKNSVTEVSFVNQIAPEARGFASVVAYDKYIIIFGGRNYPDDKECSELTFVEISEENAATTNIPPDSTFPAPRYGHSAVVHKSSMYIFGGHGDANGVFPGKTYGDVYVLDLITRKWSQLATNQVINYKRSSNSSPSSPLAPYPRYRHSAVIYNNEMIIYGGSLANQSSVDDYIWAFSLDNYTWRIIPQPTTNSAPTQNYGRYYYDTHFSNDYAAVIGGNMFFISNIVDYTSDVSPKLYSFTLGYVCNLEDSYTTSLGCYPCPLGTRTQNSVFGGICTPCAPGSFLNKNAFSCNPCAPGSYQSNAAQTTCDLCPTGFLGNSSGAVNIVSCYPCTNGTYSDSRGSSTCKPCPAGTTCPLGSSSPAGEYNIRSITSSELAFKAEEDYKYAPAGRLYLLIFLGFFVVWLIFVLTVFILVRCGRKSVYKKLTHVDFIQVIKYDVPGPILKAATVPGASISVLSGLMITALLIYVVVTTLRHNDTMVRGIGAGFSTQDFATDYFAIDLNLVGFSGQCAVSSNSSKCDSNVLVTQNGFASGASYSCTQNATNCHVSWVSAPKNSVRSVSSVQFRLFGPSTSAFAIYWNVSANSIYDGRHSYVNGFIIPEQPGSVFRGAPADPPSIVQVSLIPTILSLWNAPDTSAGITVDFQARSNGQTVNQSEYYSGDYVNNGVTVEFDMQVPQFIYYKQVLQRATTISVVSSFFALAGAIMGICKLTLTLYWIVTGVKKFQKKKAERRRSLKMQSIVLDRPTEDQ